MIVSCLTGTRPAAAGRRQPCARPGAARQRPPRRGPGPKPQRAARLRQEGAAGIRCHQRAGKCTLAAGRPLVGGRVAQLAVRQPAAHGFCRALSGGRRGDSCHPLSCAPVLAFFRRRNPRCIAAVDRGRPERAAARSSSSRSSSRGMARSGQPSAAGSPLASPGQQARLLTLTHPSLPPCLG